MVKIKAYYHVLIIGSYYVEEVINLVFLVVHPDFSSTNDALDRVVYCNFIILSVAITSVVQLIRVFVFVFNFVLFVDIHVLRYKHGAELILILFVSDSND